MKALQGTVTGFYILKMAVCYLRKQVKFYESYDSSGRFLFEVL